MVELSVGSESVRQERQTKWGGEGHCYCGKAENKIFSNYIPPKKKYLLHKSTPAIIFGQTQI